MKDNDGVKLIVEKKKYAREGVHKGAQGTICDPRNIYGQWLVDFRKEDGVHALACIPVDEEDLEVTWEAPEYKVGVAMLFLSTKEEYARQGITNGMFGVIVAKDEVLSAEHKDRYEETTYWKVKFDTDSGEKIVSVYFNHMLPIRDDELDAYKQKIASELKKRQMR